MPNHWCWISWSWPTTPSRTNTQKRCPFRHRGLKCKSRKSKDQIRSDQISHSVVSNSLRPHESQHARPPCPSPTPGVHSDSHPSSQWCHPATSSSVIPFFSCIRVFSNESTLRMRWPKYWSFSFSIIPSKEIPCSKACRQGREQDYSRRNK